MQKNFDIWPQWHQQDLPSQKAPTQATLPPTNSTFIGNFKLTSSSRKHPVASPNIRIKRISHQEAHQRKNRVQSPASNWHQFLEVMSSPCQKLASSMWSQEYIQHVHSDSVYNDIEFELTGLTNPALFANSNDHCVDKELQESFDILDALTEASPEISNFLLNRLPNLFPVQMLSNIRKNNVSRTIQMNSEANIPSVTFLQKTNHRH